MNDQKIALTGNPFVDTGLAVIAALGGLDDIGKLTTKIVREVFGQGNDLARWNSRLKSFSQVFGTNNPLFQNAYGYKKSSGPSSVNLAIYQQTLKKFLENIDEQRGESRCESCGRITDFDFSKTCTSAIELNGQKAPDKKWIGRDWFPLAGSLGSDAQALPAASRSPRICPLCLFAVHYVPLGVTLVDGRLAIFQSTSTDFWYELVLNTVHDIQVRIRAGLYETLGAKEGSRALTKRLLDLMEHLQTQASYERIPDGTALYVWRFSNAGASPDCSLSEIPSPALNFLWNAVKKGFGPEIKKFIESERRPEYSLLRCISERRDYPGFKPKAKSGGASPALFSLYQIDIRGRTERMLSVASLLARQACQELTAKELKRFQREEAIFEKTFQNRFREAMTSLCEQGLFPWADYIALFPLIESDSGIQVESDGWELVRYFLFHPDFVTAALENENLSSQIVLHDQRQKMLWYCAASIFNDFPRTIESDVIVRLKRGKIGASWIQSQFVRLAETMECFTFSAWCGLCKSAKGYTAVAELLFQMRLLWIEWSMKSIVPPTVSISCREDSGLPADVESYLRIVVSRYAENRGIKRFHRDILLRLRKRKISLRWFKKKLLSVDSPEGKPFSTEEQWESFLKDEAGRTDISERLFQMQLVLANSYRSLTQPNAEVLNER